MYLFSTLALDVDMASGVEEEHVQEEEEMESQGEGILIDCWILLINTSLAASTIDKRPQSLLQREV